jgi:hypothetical protein
MILAAVLVAIGLIKPDLSFLNQPSSSPTSVVVVAPLDPDLRTKCSKVISSLQSGDNSRKIDGTRLASLYMDLATLIELDNEDTIISNTEEITEANKLTGLMLKLNMKGKYPDLAESCDSVVKSVIGDDKINLDQVLRSKAVEAFRALAWACMEGSK